MKKINVAVVGLGQLGGEIVRQIRQKEESEKNFPIRLVGACSKTPKKFLPLGNATFTDDYKDVLSSENVDVVIEAIGGTSAAYDVVSGALMAGKHVVSANATLMATQGHRLMRQAEGSNVHLKIESAVNGDGGWIRNLLQTTSQSSPNKVYGILGSTSNYVLMRMREFGETAEKALAVANEFQLGMGDMKYDLGGQESMYRTAILRALAFGVWTDRGDMKASGITQVTPLDVQMALKMGYHIKLMSVATRDSMEVAPYLLPEGSYLGTTHGNMMALAVDSAQGGSSFMACEDTGTKTAVNGVLSDLLAIANGGKVQTIKGSLEPSPKARDERTYFVRTPLDNWDSSALPATIEVLQDVAMEDEAGIILRSRMSKDEVSGYFGKENCFVLNVWSFDN